MKPSKNKKIVLAYSGGLDTSYLVKYLVTELKMEVHAVVANNGGFSTREIKDIEKRAYFLGATSFEELDIQKSFMRIVLDIFYLEILRGSTLTL